MPRVKLTHAQIREITEMRQNNKKKNVVHVKPMKFEERMDKIKKEYEERMNKIKKEYEELVLYIYGTVIPPGAYTFDEFCDNYQS